MGHNIYIYARGGQGVPPPPRCIPVAHRTLSVAPPRHIAPTRCLPEAHCISPLPPPETHRISSPGHTAPYLLPLQGTSHLPVASSRHTITASPCWLPPPRHTASPPCLHEAHRISPLSHEAHRISPLPPQGTPCLTCYMYLFEAHRIPPLPRRGTSHLTFTPLPRHNASPRVSPGHTASPPLPFRGTTSCHPPPCTPHLTPVDLHGSPYLTTVAFSRLIPGWDVAHHNHHPHSCPGTRKHRRASPPAHLAHIQPGTREFHWATPAGIGCLFGPCGIWTPTRFVTTE